MLQNDKFEMDAGQKTWSAEEVEGLRKKYIQQRNPRGMLLGPDFYYQPFHLYSEKEQDQLFERAFRLLHSRIVEAAKPKLEDNNNAAK